MSTQENRIEIHIARGRLVMSIVAVLAVFADPTEPFLSEQLQIRSGPFSIDPWVLALMSTHFFYSVGIYGAAVRGWLGNRLLARWTPWSDVMFGAAIALLTEGATSPFFTFFMFAVVAAGFRAGLRQALAVTGASVALYLLLILVSTSGSTNVFIMRPAYLAIVGYLVGYLGEQRLQMQREIRELEGSAQRHRIARDLHDGFAQAMAGINLRLEGCRRLLQRGNAEEALVELTDLRGSVNREYDSLRAYMQALADIPPSAPRSGAPRRTRFAVRVAVHGSAELIDHVLHIAREAVSNVRRHAAASSASIEVAVEEDRVRIAIDDDGVGLPEAAVPWSIVSRVKELGGLVEVEPGHPSGAHLRIVLPEI